MRSMKLVAAGVVVTLWTLSTPAMADPANAADNVGASPLSSFSGKRVCRSLTPTGSRFEKRICKTAAEWQRDTDHNQRLIEESMRNLRSPATDEQPLMPH